MNSPTTVATFADYVDKIPPATAELPLVHTTEYRHLNSILQTHTIEPRYCKVFQEPLLYLFYGRPAYRDPSKTQPAKDFAFLPICFVFRPERYIAIERLYPFDSGASQHKLYEPEIAASRALAAYRVKAVIDSARRMISGFFETNERYMSNQPKTGGVFSVTDADAEAYYRLISGGGSPDCDDRKCAVEIQTKQPADLRNDLLAVALPTGFLEDKSLRKVLLEVWRAHPLTYDAEVGIRPSEFHHEIRRMIKEYYKDWKFI